MDSLETNFLRDAMDQVYLIQSQLLIALGHQKSYFDRRVQPLEFMEGDQIWLRISPMKGVMRFRKNNNLSPRYICPFKILERAGEISYRLALLPSLSFMHSVFHVSMLQHYILNESHVISLDSVELSPDLTYKKKSVAILDR